MQDLQAKNQELLYLATHFSQEIRIRLMQVLNMLNSKAARMKFGLDGCADLIESTQELLSMNDDLAQEHCDIVNYASNHHFVKMLSHVETAINRAYVNILTIILRMNVQMLRIINNNEVMELEDKMPSFTELDHMIFQIAERLGSLTLDE